MTLWDLRQIIESYLPWWTPFIGFGILFLYITYIVVMAQVYIRRIEQRIKKK